MDLLTEAYRAVPSIYEYALEEIQVGFRPGSRDNLPLIGETSIDSLYYATGHSRHGILLTPITALGMERLFSGKADSIMEPFSPKRMLEKCRS